MAWGSAELTGASGRQGLVDGYVDGQAGGVRCVPRCQDLGLSGSLKQTGVTLGTLLGQVPSPSCSLVTAGDVKSIKACE